MQSMSEATGVVEVGNRGASFLREIMRVWPSGLRASGTVATRLLDDVAKIIANWRAFGGVSGWSYAEHENVVVRSRGGTGVL